MTDNSEKLTCPACGKAMTEIFISVQDTNFGVDICLDGCGGIYFDRRELKYFDEQSENIDEITKALENKTFTKVDESQLRVCPVCGTNMVKNYTGIKKEVQIDECYSCGGKFLDYGELEKIRAEYTSDEERTADSIKYLYDNIGEELKETEEKASNFKPKHPLIKKLIYKLIIG